MNATRWIAPALAVTLLAPAPAAKAQVLAGGNGLQNGFAVNGLNNGFAGGFNGFGPAAVGGGFGPAGFNNGNGFAFGFGGPMNGGGTAMFYGPGVGFGGNFSGQPGFVNPMMGMRMLPPPAFAVNNLGGVAMAIDQQVVRRPGGALPAVRRRRR